MAEGDIYIRGTGWNRMANRILMVNGKTIYHYDIGLRVTTLRRTDLSTVFDGTYDIYSGDHTIAQNQLADKLWIG
ncbi:hypothetical protein [Carnobacterium viridans]|uniref:Uncharacterized protein n=1 Tax=Carnobacterium viridans TaxID=174587 RepID=A0A1H0XIJ5_9LACT|nr:hypothetical protein [Carnobacterium viridans]SDQ02772.1 hypothetical protein SAMN04487752_0294 [Carnobacterium viridans]